MAVALLMAFFFAFTFLGAAQAFAADPQSKPTPAAPSFNQDSDNDEEEDEEERHHNDLREQYGEVEQVFLPPLVVTDPSGLGGKGLPNQAPSGSQVGPNGELLGSANIDPLQNLPLDPNTISKDKQTPADSFFQLATVAISTMAAGSLALGGFALRRTVKLRKNPNSDFIYK